MNNEKRLEENREENLPKYQQIGSYESKSGGIETTLKLFSAITDRKHITSGFRQGTNRGEGDLYYFADIELIRRVIETGKGVNYVGKISLHYGCNYKDQIFDTLKLSEEYLEELLPDSGVPSLHWKRERNVLKCIFDLESKVMEKKNEK